MDCAPYCHPAFGSNQAFFFNFGVLYASSEAVRFQSCGLGRTNSIVQRGPDDWNRAAGYRGRRAACAKAGAHACFRLDQAEVSNLYAA